MSVAVRKLQVAILARSSQEMSQTVRIDCRSFLSRVRISVWPNNFCIGEKQPNTIVETESPANMSHSSVTARCECDPTVACCTEMVKT